MTKQRLRSAKRIKALPDKKLDRKKAQSVRGGNAAPAKISIKFSPEYTRFK